MADTSDGTVALFLRRFLPYSQTFIYDEIQAHERYDVEVFCQERLNAERFPYERYVKPSGWWGEKIYENIGYWPSFDRLIGRRNHALIHAHFGTAAVYALPYVLRHDVPFAITFHGVDVGNLFGARRFLPGQWRYWAYSRLLFRHADRLLADSIELAELLGELGAPREKLHVHRLGVDVSRFSRAGGEEDRPVRIVMVGRFTPKKGFTYALRACAKALERTDREAEVVMVGSGEQEAELRRLARAPSLEGRVRFRGALPHEQVAEVLSRADVMLTPSVVTRTHDRDSGIVVAKEASASEVPVVGTYHGGIPSIIDDGETGFLVPERNVDALADRLTTLLEDASLRRRFGTAARKKMKRSFDMHDQVRALEEHYDAVRR